MKRLLILTALTLALLLVAQSTLQHATWLTLTLSSSHGDCGSWDALAVVVRVVDGDTFRATITCVSGAFSGRISVGTEYRVRLADVNAPELGTVEGERARRALENLIQGRTVMLDVDGVDVFDRYGRIIAVAYIDYNETHILNINKWLLEEGYARVWDHPNEFNPGTWKLYKPRERTVAETEAKGSEDTRIHMALVLVATIVIALLALTLLRRSKR
ncbi:MAG: thermonuclease family protein [Desulfurococcales archaeon]|nr:thermonuclease family protein [Desulfurococcales archaeon]